ncbi:MAG: restriction endonuclease subunit S [Bacteroidaceae bacterium]|nr:restriction endonuclease subunit S [Bacteroidaceae bacterium]
MEEWKEYRLGEVTSILGDGIHGTPKYDDEGSIFFINGNNLENGHIVIKDNTKRVSYEESLKHRKPLSERTILVSINGTIGNVAKYNGEPCILGKSACFFNVNESVDLNFIYYVVANNNFKNTITRLATGTTIKNVSLKTMREYSFMMPSLPTQQKIASILSSLDDKIKVNRRINEQLEELAQALFKSWFVDFEPFKDGEFVESELGMIPKGWKVDYISNIPHIIETGRRPKGGVGNIISGIPSIGAENIKGLGYYDYSKTKYVTEDFADKMKKGEIKGYELLIYKDGGKPGYFIPNFSIFGEGFPFERMYLNEHVFKLDFFNRGFNAFAYFFFRTDIVMSYLNAQGGKAAIPGINQKDIEAIPILSMDNEYVKLFGNKVSKIIEKILINSKEILHLTTLRDTLLPKLMSGEIDVNEVEI